MLPLLLWLLVGTLDLGRAYYEVVALQAAASAGSLLAFDSQRASYPSTVADAEAAVRTIIVASSSVPIDPSSGIALSIPWTSGSTYSITVSKPFTLITPGMRQILGLAGGTTSITLQATITGTHS